MAGAEGTWVVTIAGLGKAGVSSCTPLAFVGARQGAGWQPATSQFVDAYAPLMRNLKFTGAGISPVSGDPRGGSVTFDLDLNDRDYPEVAKYFLATRAARTHVTKLAVGSQVDPNDDLIAVIPGTQSLIPDNAIIYIGREAWRKTALQAGVELVVDEVPDGAGNIVTRSAQITGPRQLGAIGTYTQTHYGLPATNPVPPFKEDRVFLSNPFVRGREILVWWTDGQGIEEVRGRYFIDSNPETNEDNTRISVRGVDAIAYLNRIELNRDAVAYDVEMFEHRRFEFYRLDARLEAIGRTRAQMVERQLWAPDKLGVYQIDKSAYLLSDDQGDSASAKKVFRGVDLIPHYRSELPPEDATKLTGKKAYELLVSDPLDGTEPTRGNLAAVDHPYYMADLGRVCRHPYELAFAHLSGQANLPEGWTVPHLPDDWIAGDEIAELAERNHLWSVPWSGVVAGKNGKTVKALQWLHKELLTPCGATSMTINASGQITFVSLFDYTSPDQIAEDVILYGRATSADVSVAVDSIVTRFGIGMDDEDEAHRHVADDGYESLWSGGTSTDFDMPGMVHPDRLFGSGARTDFRIVSASNMLTSVAQAFRFPLNVLSIYVTGAVTVYAGQMRRFRGPGWRDGDTGQASELVEFVGLVLQKAVDAETLTQTLTVLQLPYTGKIIGPAAEAEDYSSGTRTITVDEVRFIEPVNADGDYVLGGNLLDADTDQFTVGAICVIEDINGVVVTEPFTIESMTATTIVHTAGVPIYLEGTTTTWTITGNDRYFVVLADSGDARQDDLDEHVYLDEGDTYAL